MINTYTMQKTPPRQKSRSGENRKDGTVSVENTKTVETYYTVKEVAEILKIHLATVYQLVRTGRLRAVHIGRAIRIPESSFDALLSPAPSPAPAKPTRRIITKIV